MGGLPGLPSLLSLWLSFTFSFSFQRSAIFKVRRVLKRIEPHLYMLESLDGKVNKKLFYPQQLRPIEEDQLSEVKEIVKLSEQMKNKRVKKT